MLIDAARAVASFTWTRRSGIRSIASPKCSIAPGSFSSDSATASGSTTSSRRVGGGGSARARRNCATAISVPPWASADRRRERGCRSWPRRRPARSPSGATRPGPVKSPRRPGHRRLAGAAPNARRAGDLRRRPTRRAGGRTPSAALLPGCRRAATGRRWFPPPRWTDPSTWRRAGGGPRCRVPRPLGRLGAPRRAAVRSGRAPSRRC